MKLKPHRRISAQDGFTIVELMIATLVFAVILVIITGGVIKFTEDYYKGLNSSTIQTTARDIMTTIAQNVQFGGGSGSVQQHQNGTNGVVCAGSIRFYYQLGVQAKNGYGITRVTAPDLELTDSGCADTDLSDVPAADQKQQLLGPQMRLTDIDSAQASDGVVDVSVGIAYGDDDLLCSTTLSGAGGCGTTDATITTAQIADADNGPNVTCKGQNGNEFCAVAHLSTEVQPRF